MSNLPRNPYVSRAERMVAGLRTEAPPSEVIVYKLNPDGTKTFLRKEQPNIRSAYEE